MSQDQKLSEEFRAISQSLREINYRMDAMIETQLKSIQATNQLLEKIAENTGSLRESVAQSTDLSQLEDKLDSAVEELSEIKASVLNIELR
mgnify:CR=1 FL=1